jgi:hypothetical protein
MSLNVKIGSHDQVVDLWERKNLESVEYNQWYASPTGRYLVPSWLSGSDYTPGGLVPLSNYKAWCKQFPDGEGVWWGNAPGGYNTYAIVIDTQAVPEDLEDTVAEFLNGLQDYPLADEDLHSELEMEAQNAAWESWVKDEFKSAIEKEYEQEFGDKLPDKVFDEQLYELFHCAFDAINAEWINENGDSMHVNIERLVRDMQQHPECVRRRYNLLLASRKRTRKLTTPAEKRAERLRKKIIDIGEKPQSYSGRGMEGKYCLGVTVDYPGSFLMELSPKERKECVRDSMGLSTIIYWPHLPFTG